MTKLIEPSAGEQLSCYECGASEGQFHTRHCSAYKVDFETGEPLPPDPLPFRTTGPETQTPRTDALTDEIEARGRLLPFTVPEDHLDALALCRQLERELAAANARAEEINELVYFVQGLRVKENKAAAARCGALQAKIDSLMLEYCPGEMTPKQLATWQSHQADIETPGQYSSRSGHE